MIFIGDVHGKFTQLTQILDHYKDEDICQVGDMGIGFPNNPYPKDFGSNFKFCRGNHDSPLNCRNHPNYLGDYGYLEKQKMFYLSGAWSIDWQHRIEGVSIWKDEELDWMELTKAASLYVESKPEIVISHDCPDEVVFRIIKGRNKIQTRTSNALQAMFEQHTPRIWIFGHHHESYEEYIKGCEFRCLNELEHLEILNLKW